MALQQIVEPIVTGLGYALVEIERSAGGLLRVTIDLPWPAPNGAAAEPAPDGALALEPAPSGAGTLDTAPNGATALETMPSGATALETMPNGATALETAPNGATALETAPNGAVSTPAQSVTLEDCEKVTRQLQFALEVDGVQYQRLEVASPGIDRPLRGEQDLLRFAGSVIDITLKAPIGGAAAGKVGATRKKFRGTLERTASGGWQIVWSDAPPPKPGQRVGKKRLPAPLQALGFSLDEVRDMRLAPIVDFKGRTGKAGAAPAG
ncbi:ribosome maturation factor RimP [Verminephrobacter eiseniae]|uniref:ribosome maturation factor RimP n=1 Tax=Verminephrobacter eiseniae TaxID=364317 RepID=UPI002A515BDB|nr:ribosome maturation factor RimP [Verminephrobacter eiseniae]MCW5232069.1 ribosome maturation factor RimP [Verminephrobacter eiseniae]MCW5258787.1 ribosome maturation factor RimP [Verminephrobacter eiseniae]